MKRYILTLALALCAVASWAATYTYMNYVATDSTIKQTTTDGLVIKFVGGNIVATTATGTLTVALSRMDYLELSNIQQADDTYAKGDVDGSGMVDIDDVNIVINIILGKDNANNYAGRAYVTGQNVVDIADMNYIINKILNKTDD